MRSVPVPQTDAGAAVALQLAAGWAIAHLNGDDAGGELLMNDKERAAEIGEPQSLVTGYGFAVIALAQALDEVTDAKPILRDIAARAALQSVDLRQED